MKNKQKILIISGVILLIAVISITLLFTLKKEETKPEYRVVEVTPTISKLDDGTYYMFGASPNQTFEIVKEDGYSYQVVDEENKTIETEESIKDSVITIKPKTSYEEGKNYTLTINKTKFVNEELKESNKVTFSVIRKSTQSSKLKSNVIEIKDNLNIVENNDIITLKTTNAYKENDILLVGESETQKAYKVSNCKNNECALTIPKLNEVYDEFDFYGSAILDMSEIEHNKEIEEYLAYNIKESLIDKLIPTAKAASKIDVKANYDKKEKAYIAKIHVETDPNDKVFNKSFLKYHRLSFDYEARITFKINYDINLFGNSDINLVVEIKNTPSVGLEHAEETLDEIKNGLKAYTASANVAKMLQGDYNNIETDNKKLEQGIGKIVFPTPITGLNLVVDIGLIMDFDVKANMNATLTNTNTVTIGYSTKKGLYGNLKYSNNINANMFGSASIRLGSNVSFGADLLGIINVNGSLTGGIYGKSEVDIKTTINKDEITTNLNAKTEAGLFSTISGSAKAGSFKASKVFFDGEVELYNYELPLTASSKSSEDAPVTKPTEDKPDTPDKPKDEPETPNTPNKPNVDNSNPNNGNDKPNVETTTLTKDEAWQKFEKAYYSWTSKKNYVYDSKKCYTEGTEKGCRVILSKYTPEVNSFGKPHTGVDYYLTIIDNNGYGTGHPALFIEAHKYEGFFGIDNAYAMLQLDDNFFESSGLNRFGESLYYTCKNNSVLSEIYPDCNNCVNLIYDKSYLSENYITNVFNDILNEAGISKKEFQSAYNSN